MMKILHITPHMGGGIGTVISGVCIKDSGADHAILCLEDTLNRTRLEECEKHRVPIFLLKDIDVQNLIDEFDIIQLEWWHHPLTSDFIVNKLKGLKTRLIIWSHISGCNYPVITSSFATFPDAFVFATPFSYDNPYWYEEERAQIKKQSFLAVSSGNDFSKIPPFRKKHEGFVVGYVGFLGYEKTNPNFVKLCESCADIPGIRFRIVGDLAYGQELYQAAMASPHKNLFEFIGYTENVWEQLSEIDVFACLLQKEHTGASENALLEAMYARTCPVIFRQCTEQYLVHHEKTGLVSDGIDGFSRTIRELYINPEKRHQLADEASVFVREHYSIEHTIAALHVAYDNVMNKNKCCHNGADVLGKTPFEWFRSAYMGDFGSISGVAAGKTKGSIYQYFRYFSDTNIQKQLEEMSNECRI